MEKIYVLGDLHTVSAYRLAGLAGRAAELDNAAAELEMLLSQPDAAIVLITNDLAWNLRARIIEINLKRPKPVIVEIPGIDDERGFRRSAVGYISEALGIAL